MFLPLSLKPLDDPAFDPGESIVLDAETAHIATISNRDFAAAAINAINENEKLRELVVQLAALGDFASLRPGPLLSKIIRLKRDCAKAISAALTWDQP